MDSLDATDHQAIIIWYCQQSYYNGMLQQAKQAIQSYPTCEIFKILLAAAYARTSRVQEALQAVSELVGAEETMLSALVIQNYAYKLNGDKNHVLAAQTESKIREDRRKASFTALVRAGIASMLLGKIEQATDYAERAFKINSSDVEVLVLKGWIDVKNPPEKRINYFASLQTSRENSRRLNVLLGTAKFYELEGGTHEQAILILNGLIVRYPKLCIPLIEKMLNQLATKNWEQVLETANRILSSIDSNNLDALKAKTVVILCRDGDLLGGAKSLQLFFRNLLLAEPKNSQIIIENVQLFSGIVNHDENLLIELLRVCEKLVQQNANVSEPMIELANIYLLLGKVKEAEHWYKSAVRIDESSFAALMGLAHCQLLDTLPGAKELARQQLDFLMEIQSNTMTPRLYFMSAKLCQNDSLKALTYLKTSIELVLKCCEKIPYGYSYLKELNPDFCLEIVNEYLKYSPTLVNKDDKSSDEPDNQSILLLLKCVSDASPGVGSALLLLARVSMQGGDLDEAQSALKKLLDFVDPTNAAAHLLMAQIYSRQGNFTAASQSLEVGLSYNFKVREDPLYHLISGIVEREKDNFEACITYLQASLALMDNSGSSVIFVSSSDRATLYLELISAYGKLRKFDEASALMSEAKMQFINTVEEGRVMIGNAELCLQAGDIDKAINYLNDIQPGEPYYLEAHTRLAQIYLHKRNDGNAFARCFRELVQHCPGSKTYSMLGDAYMEIQEPERAIEAYEESLKSNIMDRNLVEKMGKALVKTHQYLRAVDYYREVVNYKGCGDLKLDMAELFMQMKQLDKADSTLVQELQNGRNATDLGMRVKQLLLLAKVRERAGNVKSALATLMEAKENQMRCISRSSMSSPVIADSKRILAEICLSMANYCTVLRDFDGAIGHFKEALQYNNSTDANALLSLAKLYMQVNDLDKATASCSALLNADPNNESASIMMADLAFRKMDFETAAYHFRQLLLREPTYWTALARLIEVSRRTGNIWDLDDWLSRAEATMDGLNRNAGYYYCAGLLDWRTGKLNSALRHFNAARRDSEWGQQAIYNMIEICLDPDDDSALSSEAFNEEDAEYQDSRTMALKTAQRLLLELNPKGSPHEMLTHRLLENFFLLATKIKTNIERVLQDCTALASQDTLRDHVGPALGLAMAHILLKQTPRARNHLKRVSKNIWTFEDAEYLERCWLLLADIYIQSNKYDLANELLRRVLQHNATCVRAHELAGYISEKEQNYKEAAARYADAWKFGGKTKLSIGYKLAYCCLKSKKYADTIQTCNEVLRQNPDFPRIRKDILEKSINNIRT